MHAKIAAALLAVAVAAGCGGGAEPAMKEKWTLERLLEKHSAPWEFPLADLLEDLEQRMQAYGANAEVAAQIRARMGKLRELGQTDSITVRAQGFPCATINRYIADKETSANFLRAFLKGRRPPQDPNPETYLLCDRGERIYRIFLDKEANKNIAAEATSEEIPHHIAYGAQVGIRLSKARLKQLEALGERRGKD